MDKFLASLDAHRDVALGTALLALIALGVIMDGLKGIVQAARERTRKTENDATEDEG
jgi:hypothetical protein